MINALSIDVEDYFQVSALESVVRYEEWGKYESRVERNTAILLDMLEEFNVKATFFVLGWIAERFPDLVADIHSKGHEIASHGYAHRLVYKQDKEMFRNDIIKSKEILEDIIGDKVIGFRAASYSITRESLWALQILKEEGYAYDSSIFPIKHDRYGIPGAKRFPHAVKLNNTDKIIEFPLSTIRICKLNLPIAGGGYLRLLPSWLIKHAVKSINLKKEPVIIYIHPWEIDPGQPRLDVKGISRFRHYVNLKKTEAKMKSILRKFEFGRVCDVLLMKGLISNVCGEETISGINKFP